MSHTPFNTLKSTFSVMSCKISKGDTVGKPVPTQGGKIHGLGFPVDIAGTSQMSGTSLTFEGTYDGDNWFTVNDYNGVPISVPIRATQNVIVEPSWKYGSDLKTGPAFRPLKDAQIFEGMIMVRAVSNAVEKEDREIVFFIG